MLRGESAVSSELLLLAVLLLVLLLLAGEVIVLGGRVRFELRFLSVRFLSLLEFFSLLFLSLLLFASVALAPITAPVVLTISRGLVAFLARGLPESRGLMDASLLFLDRGLIALSISD
jgi:hypothetical protein